MEQTREKRVNKSILKQIANALSEKDLQNHVDPFYAQGELASVDISVEVEELGLLNFPPTPGDVKKLISISSKALFGLREQTILDENIRNSQELSSDKLNVAINEHSLNSLLNKIKQRLGLAENTALIPHLHNMLIYGPGQFFDMHQDTEKLKNMIATLVVVLPSPHIGGNLLIKHGDRAYSFSSENIYSTSVKCVAFYTDCNHQVEKVKRGHRIALTYNLVLKSAEPDNTKNANQQLKSAVTKYFATKVDQTSHKLVYFLNHSYTEHGLRWDMLKGADRANVAEIRIVAKELNLVAHLALVKIKQSWSTYGEPGNKDPEIAEFIDDEITLNYWIDKNDKKLSFKECNIMKKEICWTKDIKSFDPFKKEYEGYMGNYGGNMEYWYRRAAVVLWPESNEIPMNFMLNYDETLNVLCTLTNAPGHEKKVLEIIRKAGNFLYQPCQNDEREKILVNIALYVKDKDLALSTLSQFKWKILDCDIAELLTRLQKQYGVDWCIELLNKWKNSDNYILNGINFFLSDFLYYGGGTEIVELLLDVQIQNLINSDTQTYKTQKPIFRMKSLSKRIELLEQLFSACKVAQDTVSINKIIEHLISEPELYPELSLAEMYFKLQNVVPSYWFVHFKLLKDYLVNTMGKQVAVGMRAEDDWSIYSQLSCQCEHCEIATTFLQSKTFIKKAWPIKESIRKHVMYSFKYMDLPVDLTVEEKGSPYKLILIKNARLYKDAQKKFTDLQFYYKELQDNV